jgi:hypothetical protein
MKNDDDIMKKFTGCAAEKPIRSLHCVKPDPGNVFRQLEILAEYRDECSFECVIRAEDERSQKAVMEKCCLQEVHGDISDDGSTVSCSIIPDLRPMLTPAVRDDGK